MNMYYSYEQSLLFFFLSLVGRCFPPPLLQLLKQNAFNDHLYVYTCCLCAVCAIQKVDEANHPINTSVAAKSVMNI